MATTKADIQAKLENAPKYSLDDKSVILVVNYSKPSASRKISLNKVEVNAEKKRLRLRAEIFNTPSFKAIQKYDQQTGWWIRARTLPATGIIKSTAFRVPLALFVEVDEGLQERQQWRSELVEIFLDEYEEQKDKTAEELGDLWPEVSQKFPLKSELADHFSMEYSYLFFGTPESLPSDAFNRERVKFAENINKEEELIKNALRESFAGLVENASQRLGKNEDGKNVIFRDSMVTNMREFLSMFNARNLTDDDELAVLVQKAEAIMKGIPPDDKDAADALRKNDELRERIKGVFDGLNKEIQENAIVAPKRKVMDFDE